VNPRARQVALFTIGAIAILASINALAHSYAGLYDWAAHHRLTGWQAMTWPAEIDVFLAVGELALYVAYLDGWPARQRIWPWATAATGLVVSIAGNVGHVQALPGQPVILADRATAAASPVAAFAGLAIGLLVLKMTRRQLSDDTATPVFPPLVLARRLPAPGPGATPGTRDGDDANLPGPMPGSTGGPCRAGMITDTGILLQDAHAICQDAAARGVRLSQRALARHLRSNGHRFPNQDLRHIAEAIGLTSTAA
jgi:hypothetical protein